MIKFDSVSATPPNVPQQPTPVKPSFGHKFVDNEDSDSVTISKLKRQHEELSDMANGHNKPLSAVAKGTMIVGAGVVGALTMKLSIETLAKTLKSAGTSKTIIGLKEDAQKASVSLKKYAKQVGDFVKKHYAKVSEKFNNLAFVKTSKVKIANFLEKHPKINNIVTKTGNLLKSLKNDISEFVSKTKAKITKEKAGKIAKDVAVASSGVTAAVEGSAISKHPEHENDEE